MTSETCTRLRGLFLEFADLPAGERVRRRAALAHRCHLTCWAEKIPERGKRFREARGAGPELSVV